MERRTRILLNVSLNFSLAWTCEATAQRQWGVLDSTHYAIGDDTTLIASRHQLYRALPAGTTLIRDFTDPEEPNYFIRDVDHWSSHEFYVLVGSRYIGAPTFLFKTMDAGSTWTVDSSFFDAATEPPSLNQMTIVGDTAYLFNGYYISEVLRSYDHGITWQSWFSSLIAHYYGLIPCGNTAFIHGMVGDGFSPSMWQVPDSLWAIQAPGFWSGCHNGGAPGCYYAPSIPYPEVVQYFDSLANALCATGLSVVEPAAGPQLTLAPNPATDRIHVIGSRAGGELRITDGLGREQRVQRTGEVLAIGTLPAGVYLVHITEGGVRSTLRFVKW